MKNKIEESKAENSEKIKAENITEESKAENPEKVSVYFKQSNKKEVYGTVDGFLFERKQDAQNHADSLKDNKVLKHTK